jgi:hypothetical protein
VNGGDGDNWDRTNLRSQINYHFTLCNAYVVKAGIREPCEIGWELGITKEGIHPMHIERT